MRSESSKDKQTVAVLKFGVIAAFTWFAMLTPSFGQLQEPAERPAVTFGVVLDGTANDREDEWLLLLQDEIKDLLTREFEVRFPDDKTLLSDWEPERIIANLDNLLSDITVDIVICMGPLSTLEAAKRGEFTKPVMGTIGINGDLPIYPLENGASGVKNFTYLVAPPSMANHAEMIQRLKPVKTVHFVVSSPIAALVPGLVEFTDELFASNGMDVVYVLGMDSVDEIMNEIPDSAEFIYVSPLVAFTPDQTRELYTRLKERRLPTFSLIGLQDVKMGALAGTAPESDRLRWARRAALNIQRILLGEEPGTLPVLLEEKSQLTLNMETGRAIDWYPPWDIQIAAELLNEEPEPDGRELTLKGAVLEALDVNLGYQADQLEVLAGAEAVKETEAQRRPQIEASVSGVQLDSDTVDASFGSAAETTISGSVDFTQVVFSDQQNAAVDIERTLQRGREYELEAARLDLALDVSTRFLEYLQVKTLWTIRKNNLSLTNANLETARSRNNIGIASRSEVYRWESQVALDQQLAIEAQAQSEAALARLNQLLHFSQESHLEAIAPDMLSGEYMTGEGRLRDMVGNEQAFSRFRAFMVVEGLNNAPELKQLDTFIQAKERELVTGKRSFYTPTVAVQASLSHDFSRSGEPESLALPGLSIPGQPDTTWNAAVRVSLPLFQGGARKATVAKARVELEQLKLTRRNAAEQVEANIRSTLHLVGSANVAIDLFKRSADAARENYELVKDAYTKGVADTTDLLDAQNAALTAEQSSANAVYEFFIQLMRFQRASSNFDFFTTDADREDFFRRLEAFYKQFE